MEIVIGVLLILVSIFLIVAVLFQSSKNARLSGAIAGGAETFFGKTKGKTIDKKLNSLTIIVSIIFAIVVLALYAIQPGKAKIKYDYDFLDDYVAGVIDGSIEVTVSEEEDEEDHDHEDDSTTDEGTTDEDASDEGTTDDGASDEGAGEGSTDDGASDEDTSN